MNIAVRVAEGTDGPVILSAFCPTCATDAMPMDNGCCGFCDTPIVGDPKVKKRPADAALEAAGVLDGALTERGSTPADRRPDGRPTKAPEFFRPRSASASLERLLTDAGDLLDAIAVAKVSR